MTRGAPRPSSLRLKYEAIANIPLIVKFVGDMRADNLATVVLALLAQDLSSKSTGHHVVLDSGSGLRVRVTKAFRPDWYSVNDRVGFVDRNPRRIIADAIEKKAKELTRYKDDAGADIRLLLSLRIASTTAENCCWKNGRHLTFTTFRQCISFPTLNPCLF